MSAAPAPKSDEGSELASEADGWALLEAMRRRLDEQVGQGRKTQAQVTQLAESIAALVGQQRRRSLWLNVNSFVAYVMFTILCGAGFYLLYRSRAHELAAARDQAVGERDAAVRRADDATVRAVARESADIKAWEVYQLLEAGKRADAMVKLDALRDQPLSKTERAVLAARVHDTQVMEVDTALKAAVASFKAGRLTDVIKPLEAALTGEPPGERAATIHYYLGVAYAKTELDKAIAHLQSAIAGDVEQEDARFQLASALDRSGAYAQARGEYDRFATAHPQSQLAVFAMRRSATLARVPAPGVPAAAAPVAGASAGSAAAPVVAPPAASPAGAPAPPPAPRIEAPAIRPPAAAAVPVVPGSHAPILRPWLRPPVKPIVPMKPAAPRPVPGEPSAAKPVAAAPVVEPSAAKPVAAPPAVEPAGAEPSAVDR